MWAQAQKPCTSLLATSCLALWIELAASIVLLLSSSPACIHLAHFLADLGLGILVLSLSLWGLSLSLPLFSSMRCGLLCLCILPLRAHTSLQ